MKTKFLMFAVVMMMGFVFTNVYGQHKKDKKQACEKKEMADVDASKLPQNAQDFLAKYFPGDDIIKVKADGRLMEFEVKLGSDSEVEFSRDGQWKEVKSNDGIKVMAGDAFPMAILQYVKTNYPSNSILQIERCPFGYEIEINTQPNDTELYFDNDGNYLTKEQIKSMKKQPKK